MHFQAGYAYHLFNRSNEILFRERENYHFFIRKIKKNILPVSDIIAWCLLPNHFHLMLLVKPAGALFVEEKHRPHTQILSKKIGTLLSSYTLAFNKKYKRKGSLFAHRTRAKVLNTGGNEYPEICFNYIHQNPRISGYVEKAETWEYSSYRAFADGFDDGLVNKAIAREVIIFNRDHFREWSEIMLDEKLLNYNI